MNAFRTHVLLMFLLKGNAHALLGPIPDEARDLEKIDKVFPVNLKTKTSVYRKKTLDLSPSYRTFRIFRSVPTANQDYLSWLTKIEKVKGNIRKRQGIFDFIYLSIVSLTYCPNFLLSSLYFWEGSNNSVHLYCGMITSTLFDITTITNLRPTGKSFTPTTENENVI